MRMTVAHGWNKHDIKRINFIKNTFGLTTTTSAIRFALAFTMRNSNIEKEKKLKGEGE